MENVNNNPVSEDKTNSVGYWSTPEQVAEAVAQKESTEVVEAPKEEVLASATEEAPVEVKTTTTDEPVVSEPEPKTEQVKHLGSVSNGVMGSTSVAKPAPRLTEKAKSEDSEEKVAIHSTKNVAWQGVGKVSRGYNIVTKEAADQWLTRPHVRIATPEEIKKAFG